jgi:FtsH-binding integral membrane protein
MSDFDRNYSAVRGFGADRAAAIDQGLRAHMIRVYNYMAVSVAITGVVSMLVAQYLVSNPALVRTLYSGPAGLLVFLVPLGIAFFMGFRIHTMQPATARAVLFFYAASVGLMLAPIFLVYTSTSVARVFFITAAAFGGLSLYGYTTQRSLAAMGAFMYMGAIGIFIAILVNMFLQSSALDFAISIIGVLVFAGLTAWHTQAIKEMYEPMDDGTIAGRKAVLGAWLLYADFVNMFLFLLRLFGDRR